MVVANLQLDGRWQPSIQCAGSRKMGCRALHRKTAEDIDSRTDVECRQAQQRQSQPRRLWFWMGELKQGMAIGWLNTAGAGSASQLISPDTQMTSCRSSFSPT